jgi:hypothetical protein
MAGAPRSSQILATSSGRFYSGASIHLNQADDVAPGIVSSPANKHEELARAQF